MSSLSGNDLCTPRSVCELLYELAGADGWELDPCSSPRARFEARRRMMLERGEDGLRTPWHAPGAWVYVNPPYSDIKRWTGKIIDEVACGARVVALVPEWCDRTWWHRLAAAAGGWAHWHGRIVFEGGDQSPRIGNVFFLLGADHAWARFRRVFAPHAVCARPDRAACGALLL